MEENPFELPETSQSEIVDKIEALAVNIRMDWSDPRAECREIVRLCSKLNELFSS